MEDLVEWLRKAEHLACDFYAEAAKAFKEDKAFQAFLQDLSKDEAMHYHLVNSAATALDANVPLGVAVGEEMITRVESAILENLARLRSGTATKQEVLDCIVESEYSEWNDLFIYLMRRCRTHSRTFQGVASAMQTHADKITDYLNKLDPDLVPRTYTRKLPEVWSRRYLIVDDDAALRELYEDWFSSAAEIVTASNGKEALELLKDSYFDIVVSDIEMPVMNGMDFFRNAVEQVPDIQSRFLFCSGYTGKDAQVLCADYSISFISKPMVLTELDTAIAELLDNNVSNSLDETS